MVFVKRCCCCVNLRVGGLMMGLMTLALSLFSLFPTVAMLLNRWNLARLMTHLVRKYRDPTYDEDAVIDVAFWGSVDDQWVKENEQRLPSQDDEDVRRLAVVMLIFFIAAILALLIYAICSALLMYATYKAKRWLLTPWLLATFTFLVVYFLGLCLTLYLVGVHIVPLLLFLIAIVEIAVAFYLWMCIVSLFQALANVDFREDLEMDDPKFNTKYSSVPTNNR